MNLQDFGMLKILRNRLISGERLEAKITSISKRLLREIWLKTRPNVTRGLFEDQRLEQGKNRFGESRID